MALTRVWTPTGNYSGGSTKRLIVLHTTEGFTGPNGAYDCAKYFQGDVGASSQVCIDNNRGKVWEGVSRANGSWTQCNYNSVAVSAEQCGYASWSRDYWLSNRENELRNTADWIAEESRALGIPIRELSGPDGSGVTYHSRLGSSGCGHSDPGSGYPLDVVLDWALGGGGGSPTPTPEPEDPFALEDQMPHLDQDQRFYMASFGNSRYTWVSFFCDNTAMGWPSQRIRVAPWTSEGHTYSGVVTVVVDNAHQKVTAALPKGCAGVHISRELNDEHTDDWAPVGFNFG
jgi:hypothetical protein